MMEFFEEADLGGIARRSRKESTFLGHETFGSGLLRTTHGDGTGTGCRHAKASKDTRIHRMRMFEFDSSPVACKSNEYIGARIKLLFVKRRGC